MSKHTPGPWEIKSHFDSCYRYISAPEHIALAQVVWCVEEEERSPVCEANAHLIAAAPELLEALEMGYRETMDYIRLNHLPGAEDNHWLQLARAAIAKAKGENCE